MYIEYINLLDKSFRVKNVFLDKEEQLIRNQLSYHRGGI